MHNKNLLQRAFLHIKYYAYYPIIKSFYISLKLFKMKII